MVCPKCHCAIEPTDTICPVCGKTLQHGKTARVLAVLGIAAVVIINIAIILYIHWKL